MEPVRKPIEEVEFGQLFRVAWNHMRVVCLHHPSGEPVKVNEDLVGRVILGQGAPSAILIKWGTLVDLVDADFFVGDECVTRTYSRGEAVAWEPSPKSSIEPEPASAWDLTEYMGR